MEKCLKNISPEMEEERDHWLNRGGRRCHSCGTPINECWGVTKAGDIIEVIEGKRATPRELCGNCCERFEWTEHGTLRSPRTDVIEFWKEHIYPKGE